MGVMDQLQLEMEPSEASYHVAHDFVLSFRREASPAGGRSAFSTPSLSSVSSGSRGDRYFEQHSVPCPADVFSPITAMGSAETLSDDASSKEKNIETSPNSPGGSSSKDTPNATPRNLNQEFENVTKDIAKEGLPDQPSIATNAQQQGQRPGAGAGSIDGPSDDNALISVEVDRNDVAQSCESTSDHFEISNAAGEPEDVFEDLEPQNEEKDDDPLGSSDINDQSQQNSASSRPRSSPIRDEKSEKTETASNDIGLLGENGASSSFHKPVEPLSVNFDDNDMTTADQVVLISEPVSESLAIVETTSSSNQSPHDDHFDSSDHVSPEEVGAIELQMNQNGDSPDQLEGLSPPDEYMEDAKLAINKKLAEIAQSAEYSFTGSPRSLSPPGVYRNDELGNDRINQADSSSESDGGKEIRYATEKSPGSTSRREASSSKVESIPPKHPTRPSARSPSPAARPGSREATIRVSVGPRDDTPRTSNNRKVLSEPTVGDWSSKAVELVASNVSIAISTLRNITSPYLPSTLMDKKLSAPPETVDTSTDLTLDEEESTDLNIDQLHKELRSSSVAANSKSFPDEKKEDHSDQERSRSPSSRSIDTLGRPLPIEVIGQVAKVSPTRVKKPLPVPTPKAQNKKSSPEIGTNSPQRDDSLMRTLPPRSLTPIMRMRYAEAQQSMTIKSEEKDVQIPKSEEEVKAAKQRKWKEKMRIAEIKREQERRSLEGERMGRPRKQSKDSDTEDEGSVASTVPFVCHSPFILLERLVGIHCGQAEDAISTHEESRDREGDESTDESDEASDEEDQTRRSEKTSNVGRSSTDGAKDRSQVFIKSANELVGRARQLAEQAPKAVASLREQAPSIESLTCQPKHFFPAKAHKNAETRSVSTSPIDQREVGNEHFFSDTVENEPSVADEMENVAIHDKSFVRSFIALVTTKGMKFFVHRKNGIKSFYQPKEVTVYLRLGARGRGNVFDEPRLTWEADDSVELGGVDLFDIRSLDRASALHLDKYPLAMPGRSLFLRLKSGVDRVFEALDEEASVRFIHGIRWVVARFAFNLIIGNLSVSCELLDVQKDDKKDGKAIPTTPLDESHWATAVNDITNHMVDKATTP